MKNNFIVKFKGRNISREFVQNFLWNDEHIYIMDNHRAALWCWLQKKNIKENEKYNFFHIDAHYDTLYSNIETWNTNMPKVENLTINEYLEFKYQGELGPVRLFRYDNYLSLFLENYSLYVDELYCTVPHGGSIKNSPPRFKKIKYIGTSDLPAMLKQYFGKKGNKILNLDLDYFFDEYSGKQVVSNFYINDVLGIIAKNYHEKNLECLTVALSPDCCHPDYIEGWKNAEKTCAKLSKFLNISFKLP